ncbi:iron ABC transporter substrate-binding protein [Lentzea flava]|uniref:Iron ABC transporter substrate-binding protein n=1 Tax=Lentzea flava TaxID=103732 RepID=A0ABQ2UIZ2_9PSEU|nr:iron ABC transporter substrate-binding protein [Lentzea flava]MCP2199700.1 iron(III) transport system substrate-binding protein [Lentzea flava]GGU38915.1 iron ABC transporter substrate-binding protein [Lentzea flava]
MRHRARTVTLVAALLASTLSACSSANDLIIYSGRNEQLVGGLLDQLEDAVGIDVQVRYGGSGEMAAQLLEEGQGTEADLFFSQDAGALGAVGAQGRLAELPADVLGMVPENYRARDKRWVATSARARVIAYDPRVVQESELPKTVEEVVDPKWKGKIGYAPTNGSWQAFVTSVRVLKGEDFAKDWLKKFAANEPKRFDNNNSILKAVDDGQLPFGLINHYYWYAMVAEKGGQAGVKARLHRVGNGDPLALVNVAGVGIIQGTNQSEAAQKAVRFLLSEKAQRHFADVTAEYPANPDVKPGKHQLPPITDLQAPDLDLSKLSSLQETLKLLQEAGLS